MAASGDEDSPWARAVAAGRRLGDALKQRGHADLAVAAGEVSDRLAKFCKRLGARAAGLTGHESIGSVLRSILQGFEDAVQFAERGGDEEGLDLDKTCRVLLMRRVDLLEAMLESFVKRQEDTAEKVVRGVLQKVQKQEAVDRAWKWWDQRIGEGRQIVPYEDWWAAYLGHYGKMIPKQDDPHGVDSWKSALNQIVDYTQDGTVSVHEYAFLCLWWFPVSFSPGNIGLFLKQAYFRPMCDRRNYHYFLRSPGDFCVRNTINQGGGWCVSYVDQHLKAKHTLLGLKDHKWVFPNATSPEKATSANLVQLIHGNTDILQMPRGVRFDSLPSVDWDGYTEVAQDYDTGG
eukprot:Hpha_TRINITY_DN5813_c0_g1::TRINITY_DN5813_c0_g1_i1::g.45525::m.45525